MERESAQLVAAILNAAWMVRHHARQARFSRAQSMRRLQAIHLLGLTVRDAFDKSDDFEALLTALVDGLRPKEDQPF